MDKSITPLLMIALERLKNCANSLPKRISEECLSSLTSLLTILRDYYSKKDIQTEVPHLDYTMVNINSFIMMRIKHSVTLLSTIILIALSLIRISTVLTVSLSFIKATDRFGKVIFIIMET